MLKQLIFLTTDKQIQENVKDFLTNWTNDSTTIRVKTSGSTGIPKEILVKKEHMRCSARKTIETFSIPKGGIAFLCLSIETIAGKMMVVRAIENNMTLYVGDVRSNALCHASVNAIDLMAVVPIQLSSGITCNPNLIRNSKTILVGGGTIGAAIINSLKPLGVSAIHTYGMTETLSHIAYRKIGKKTDNAFTLLHGIDIKTVNDCLVINYPEIDIYNLQTTDVVSIKKNGKFILRGRADHIINSGGMKFNPEELEASISEILHLPFFIASIPDVEFGQRIILILEGSELKNQKRLLEEIKPLLPKYGCPKDIRFIPKFIRSESMKILRKETLTLL